MFKENSRFPGDTVLMKVNVIILAAGKGQRFGNCEGFKQFKTLAGKPIVQHSIEIFQNDGRFNNIYVTVPKPITFQGKVSSIVGGNTRQQSTHLALRAMPNCDYVFIHDAVRPLLDKRILDDCWNAIPEYDVVDVCIECDDSLVLVENETYQGVTDRSKIRRGQTPQVFKYDMLLKAYDWFHKTEDLTQEEKESFTDDLSVFQRAYTDVKCKLVQGSPINLKITHPADLIIAEQMIHQREDYPFIHSLQGKTVMVIGGSGGIGTEVIWALKERGAEVLAPNRNQLDITEMDDWDEYATLFPMVDSIIYLAGDAAPGRDYMTLRKMFNVNVKAQSFFFDVALQTMKEGSSIVMVGSSSAFKGRSEFPYYSATKAAAQNMFEGFVDLFKSRNIKINSVVPGRTNTSMLKKLGLPSEGALDPKHVAQAIIKYCDPPFTGQTFNIRR